MNPLLYRFLRPKPQGTPPTGVPPPEPQGCARGFWIGMIFFALVFGFLFWYFEIR